MELTADECRLILHCMNNALWIRQNEAAMKFADGHILVLNAAQAHEAVQLLPKLVEASRDGSA